MKILLALAVALLASCGPLTPEARIQASPAIYEKLSDSHKTLVRQGRVDRGMSTDAVYLAWGKPAREFAGSDSSGSTLRWDYSGSRPVYSTDVFGSYGYGGYAGPYGRRYPRYGYGIAPQIEYVPYHKATVWFTRDRVTKWEQAR